MFMILDPCDSHYTSSHNRSDHCTEPPSLSPASWSTALQLGPEIEAEKAKASKNPWMVYMRSAQRNFYSSRSKLRRWCTSTCWMMSYSYLKCKRNGTKALTSTVSTWEALSTFLQYLLISVTVKVRWNFSRRKASVKEIRSGPVRNGSEKELLCYMTTTYLPTDIFNMLSMVPVKSAVREKPGKWYKKQSMYILKVSIHTNCSTYWHQHPPGVMFAH